MEQCVADLIARSYGEEAADAFRVFVPQGSQLAILGAVGGDVLKNFPPMAGACALMNATFAARCKMSSDSPVYVVAGELWIGLDRVFGEDDTTRDWSAAFSSLDMSWDGHCWLVLGEYVADISLFRTAYSTNSPPILARHVLQNSALAAVC